MPERDGRHLRIFYLQLQLVEKRRKGEDVYASKVDTSTHH